MHRHLGGPEVSRCSRINIRKCPLSVPDERAGLLIIKNAAGGIRARVYAPTYVRLYDNHVCTVTVKVLVHGQLKSRKDIRTYVRAHERARGMSFRFTVGGIILLSVTSHLSFCPTG